MKLPWKKDQPNVNPEIERILDRMKTIEVDSNDYRKLMVRLDRFYKLKTHERREPVSRDVLVSGAFNLLGILVVVVFERNNSITSKAFGQIFRARSSS